MTFLTSVLSLALTNASVSFSVISTGVPLRTANPCQSLTRKLGKPSSDIVGTSLKLANLSGLDTANAFNRPLLMKPVTGEVAANIKRCWPPTRSVMACGN